MRSKPELCRWCGGRMIHTPNGGSGIVCDRCWWPSAECRCPIRPELVTTDTPRTYVVYNPCGHAWGRRPAREAHAHVCSRPHEHQGPHACEACGVRGRNPNSVIPA